MNSPKCVLRAWAGSNYKRLERGFSLVEVTLSLGLLAFSMIPLFGLLPIGLQTVKTARDAAGASNALEQITSAVRSTSSANQADYQANFGDLTLAYTIGGQPAVYDFPSLGHCGFITHDEERGRLRARLEIIPPAHGGDVGRAIVTVAWPNTAVWSDGKWKNAQGSIATGIQFIPKR